MTGKYLVFDIETTGLPRRQNAALDHFDNWPHIVQLSWILYDENAAVLHSANYIVKPTDYHIPQSVTNTHGISHDYAVANGEDAKLVLGTFYELLIANKPILIGHNVKFDSQISQVEFLRHEIENVIKPLNHVCTMQMALKMMEGSANKFPKLSELHFHLFKEDFAGHHNAMADVKATARCFFEMTQLKSDGKLIPAIAKSKSDSYVKFAKDQINIDIDANEQFNQVVNVVKNTTQSLFLTGRAGTGKSTLLRYLLSHVEKNFIVVAPTGIAALNVGGVTIHSFFRFPLRPLLPDDEDIPTLSYPKQRLIKTLDTLIIDEVSMVRVDILDAIDASLRKNGGNPSKPFGGKQIILIGDVFQLEPVTQTKDGTMAILLQYYRSVYFFNAPSFQSLSQLAIIELQKVYRQNNDAFFLSLLDKIRVNQLDENDFLNINMMVEEEPVTAQQLLEDNAIVLKTTNHEADETNSFVLNIIEEKPYRYHSIISGIFPLNENRIPAPQVLELKVNAQVMLLKNDIHGRWVNGTIAKIVELAADTIKIQLANSEIHGVDLYTWENLSYRYNPATRKIDTNVLGGYTQYPLRLAWAITIHKSQGLTFDKIKVDWGLRTFASGQVYVALSRCRTMNGVVMSRALRPHDIIVNEELITFYNDRIANV